MDFSQAERYGRPRQRLWEELLAGRITEVYALSDTSWTAFIPQTLGLEPIYYSAYVDVVSTAEWRSVAELEQIARAISAERRWITGGGPPFWDRHFAERAQVALVFPSGNHQTTYDYELLRANISAALKSRLPRRRARDSDSPSALDAIPPQPKSNPSAARMQYLLSEYPEKTIRVTSYADRATLRKVRALPPEALQS